MIQKTLRMTTARSGQSIYQTMLAIACAALLLGIVLSGVEYYAIYQTDWAIEKLPGGIPSSKSATSGYTPAPKADETEESETPAPADEAAPEGSEDTEAPENGEG